MKNTKMLKKNYEFRNVFSKGKYYSGKYIEAFIKKNYKNFDFNYLGIAISVKSGKAVRRNKIKRLIRESYKILENDIYVGQSFVFLWKKKVSIDKASFKNIKEDMNNIFEKSNLKNKEI